MELIGYIVAVLIGLSLGLIGGGGSILTVPVLVYLFHTEPVLATTYSLFIVGVTSLAGGTKAYMNHLVDFRAVSLFGIPSILTVFIARHFILPIIPQHIARFGAVTINKGSLLMLLFALLMLVAALSMMRRRSQSVAVTPARNQIQANPLSLLVPGLMVGLVTGILGAGGGFLIIPALVLLVGLPMKTAVGTSLLIIAINSLFGFVFSLGHYPLQWPFLLGFTGLAVAGVFAGIRIGARMDSQSLKRWFAWFVLAMSLYILVREFIF